MILCPLRLQAPTAIFTYLDVGFPDATKKACEDTEGIKFKGSYVPHQVRYHYAFVYKCDDYGKMGEVNRKVQKTFPRDRNQMTHAIIEVMTEA